MSQPELMTVVKDATKVGLVAGALDLGASRFILQSREPSRAGYSGDVACALVSVGSTFLGEVAHAYIDAYDQSSGMNYTESFRPLVPPALSAGASVAADKFLPLGNPKHPLWQSAAKGALVNVAARSIAPVVWSTVGMSLDRSGAGLASI